MANHRRPIREFRGGSDAVTQFLAEVSSRLCAGRTVRQQALLCLRFFGPLTAALWTRDALQCLMTEFGGDLPAGSWLRRQLESE